VKVNNFEELPPEQKKALRPVKLYVFINLISLKSIIMLFSAEGRKNFINSIKGIWNAKFLVNKDMKYIHNPLDAVYQATCYNLLYDLDTKNSAIKKLH